MEDQQPAAGDLTDVIETEVVETAAAESESEAPEAEFTTDSAVGDETDDGTTEAEIGVRHRRQIGKWSAIAAAVMALLFVGSAAFAGAAVQPFLTDHATVATKQRVAVAATNAITTLWTYTPDNIDKLADRAAQYLSGDFEAEYRKYMEQIVAPTKQAKVTTSTKVTGVAVESLKGPDATAIVYTNTQSESPATKDIPSLKYLSFWLTLKRESGRWLVTRMTTITQLDLTPKF